jgi:hypothetical protein
MHTFNLTNGAAERLAQLICANGLLTDPAQLSRCNRFWQKHLLDIPEEPTPPAGRDPAAIKAHNIAFKAWSRTELPISEVSEKTRDALKALVTAAAAKGALSGGAEDGVLLAAVGLGAED